MQTSHTPGTIHQGAGNGEGSIFTDTEGARRGTDGTCSLSPLFIVNGKTPEDQANAARLVAAWNACEGLDTELLAGMGAGTFVRHADRFYALRVAADKAAACLAECLRTVGDNNERADEFDAALEALSASLNNTEDSMPAKLAEQRDAALALLVRVQDAFWQLADEAGDVPEWNEGGSLYELARDIRRVRGDAAQALRSQAKDDAYRVKVAAGKVPGRALVSSLYIGRRVDLEADPIADPGGLYAADNPDEDGAGTEHPEFAYQFETVASIERESPDCIRVDFKSGFSCGFPADHVVDVDPEQVRSPVPLVIVKLSGGLIEEVTTDREVRVCVIDSDTEGGDESNIREVDGEDYYVSDSANEIDAQRCAAILAQVDDEDAAAMTEEAADKQARRESAEATAAQSGAPFADWPGAVLQSIVAVAHGPRAKAAADELARRESLTVYEVTGAGFDSGTDATDDRVIWIRAASAAEVEAAISGLGATMHGELPHDCGTEGGLDYTLPGDSEALRARLLAFLGAVPSEASTERLGNLIDAADVIHVADYFIPDDEISYTRPGLVRLRTSGDDEPSETWHFDSAQMVTLDAEGETEAKTEAGETVRLSLKVLHPMTHGDAR